MRKFTQNYINGEWVESKSSATFPIVSPATENTIGLVTLSKESEVNDAVKAAKTAFGEFSISRREDRIEILNNIVALYRERWNDIADAMTEEMGAPITLARSLQAEMGVAHFETARDILDKFEFEDPRGMTLIRKEPIGVCGFITPWNWPMNQIACKAAPAIATGCTFVWKPSENTPFSARILMEIFDQAGLPNGVANLVQGDGPTVGKELASHPDIDMVSFTGSSSAGSSVAIAAAPSVKRVSQELGGKSANIILDDLTGDALIEAVETGINILAMNSGQNCNAPSRMLVPRDKLDEIAEIARQKFEQMPVGEPSSTNTSMGPVVSEKQWNSIQMHIRNAIDEGVKLLMGGVGRPDGLGAGFYVKPTIFVCDDNNTTIAQNEVFGPVLAIVPYEDNDQCIEIANDSEYGLSGYVFSQDLDRANGIAASLRTGMVHINGIAGDMQAPFGGYKQSGNGREWGEFGFEEFLEVKAVIGFNGKAN